MGVKSSCFSPKKQVTKFTTLEAHNSEAVNIQIYTSPYD